MKLVQQVGNHELQAGGNTVANDQEKPKIEDGTVPNPIDCQQYKKGETLPFHYTYTDNVELGNFNIEIHNNFDHHTHSTSADDCPLDDKKSPVNPWVYNQDQAIPAGLKSYEAKVDSIRQKVAQTDIHTTLIANGILEVI